MGELLNLFLNDTLSESAYKSKQIKVTHNYPTRESAEQHGMRLLSEYAQAKRNSQSITSEQVAAIKAKEGCYFDISGLAGQELLVKSLESVSSGIRICNVRSMGEKADEEVIATVYVPDSKEHIFLKKIEDYAKGNPEGKTKPAHDDLVRSIEKIRMSVVQSLWTDGKEYFPSTGPAWCEIWLRAASDRIAEIRDQFFALCNKLDIHIKDEFLIFPDRIVCAAYVSGEDLSKLLQMSDCLAEFRRLAEPNSFFTGLETSEQKEWVDDLLARIKSIHEDVAVCILDTGVNNEHPLLRPLYGNDSVHKAREYIVSGADMNGHGTQMAGIAGYGDLKKCLESGEDIFLNHSLESVKLIGSKENEPELYGEYTKQAVSIAEISNPEKTRVVCLAVTAESTSEKKDGRPSSWSAAIDSLASGADDGAKRLFLISAGNVQLSEYNEDKQIYPDACVLHQVEDPAQAWNALTVGAYTDRLVIDSPYLEGYQPITDAGTLSPFSSTSSLWRSKWPIKPEILCEGGNAAKNDEGTVDTCDNLCVLTTHHRPTQKLFTTTNATSAAVANASWMAAEIAERYPDCWPETVRALLVASARWPEKMFNMFCHDEHKKKEVQKLLRSCGYGIADIGRAEYCAESSVNMIIETELQPFQMRGGYCGFGQMHMHQLPWPTDYLLDMREAEVELKVVLSYFIEPGPGEIGFNDRYRYPSCGLRFDVNNVGESKERFEYRINQQMRDERDDVGTDTVTNDNDRWIIGVNGRSSGSLHCDIWKGTAAELSESNLIAVYPTSGWWRTRSYLKRQSSKIRYSLVVTLSTPSVEAHLYTEIINKISIPISIENSAIIGR